MTNLFRKTAIYQGRFLDLVNLVSLTTWYTFKFQFSKQTDGVEMVSPELLSIAEI